MCSSKRRILGQQQLLSRILRIHLVALAATTSGIGLLREFFPFFSLLWMTLPDLLANEELRQHEFPVTRERIFLAHGGDCPLPRRVAEAISTYARQCTTGDQEKFVYPMVLD